MTGRWQKRSPIVPNVAEKVATDVTQNFTKNKQIFELFLISPTIKPGGSSGNTWGCLAIQASLRYLMSNLLFGILHKLTQAIKASGVPKSRVHQNLAIFKYTWRHQIYSKYDLQCWSLKTLLLPPPAPAPTLQAIMSAAFSAFSGDWTTTKSSMWSSSRSQV